MKGIVLILGCLLVGALCTTLPSATMEGRRWFVDHGCLRADDTMMIEVALTQRDGDKLLEKALSASTPGDVDFAKTFSIGEIRDMVYVQESEEAVKQYFEQFGLVVDTVLTGDFLVVSGTSLQIANAFSLDVSDLRYYRHSHSSRIIKRARVPVGMPKAIRPHVDLIVGLTDFLRLPFEKKVKKVEGHHRPWISPPVQGDSQEEVVFTANIYCKDGTPLPCPESAPQPTEVVIHVNGSQAGSKQLQFKVEGKGKSTYTGKLTFPPYTQLNMSVSVTYSDSSIASGIYPIPNAVITKKILPATAYEQYHVPAASEATHPDNLQSVAAFEGQYVSLDDLDAFFSKIVKRKLSMPPVIQGENDPSQPGGESTLDLQWIMAMGYNAPTIFWSVSGPGPAKGGHAYILTWAMQISNTTKAPLVTSISYGDTEQGYYNAFGNYNYIRRMERELAKMTLRRLSVIAGSGDAGATNVGEEGNDISPTDRDCNMMRPFYPSNSPFVTSLSASFVTAHEESVSCKGGIFWTTGGGFGNYSYSPAYQNATVAAYVAKQASLHQLPPDSMFNRRGRGYPDVSALGHNLRMIVGGKETPVGGTSASGPLFAGLLTLINDKLLHSGKRSLGLINPILYANPSMFTDISIPTDNSPGDFQPPSSPYPIFCPHGFHVAEGWDAVSGLGAPNFPVMEKVFLATIPQQ